MAVLVTNLVLLLLINLIWFDFDTTNDDLEAATIPATRRAVSVTFCECQDSIVHQMHEIALCNKCTTDIDIAPTIIVSYMYVLWSSLHFSLRTELEIVVEVIWHLELGSSINSSDVIGTYLQIDSVHEWENDWSDLGLFVLCTLVDQYLPSLHTQTLTQSSYRHSSSGS